MPHMFISCSYPLWVWYMHVFFSLFFPIFLSFPKKRRQGLELAFAGKALGALAAFGVGRSVGCQVLKIDFRHRSFSRWFPSWKFHPRLSRHPRVCHQDEYKPKNYVRKTCQLNVFEATKALGVHRCKPHQLNWPNSNILTHFDFNKYPCS